MATVSPVKTSGKQLSTPDYGKEIYQWTPMADGDTLGGEVHPRRVDTFELRQPALDLRYAPGTAHPRHGEPAVAQGHATLRV